MVEEVSAAVNRFASDVAAVLAEAGSDLDDITVQAIQDQLSGLRLAAEKDEEAIEGESVALEKKTAVYRLNVGGEEFFVPADIVAKDPCCNIADIAACGNVPAFVDRDPTHFPFILRWLSALDLAKQRRPLLSSDVLIRAEIRSEAGFYGVKTLVDALGGEMNWDSLLGAEFVQMRDSENVARAEFIADPKSSHPFLHLISVFEPAEFAQFVFPQADTKLPLICCELPRTLPKGGSSLAVHSTAEFQKRFYESCPVLSGLVWDNLFVAGGSVVASLVPPQTSKASDVDLFIHGITSEAEAIAVLRRVYNTVAFNLGKSPLVVRTARTLTIVSGGSNLHVQIILRLYESPAEVLLGFDLDCVACGFDGESVWCLPRCRRALNYRMNLADPSRQTFRTTSYEYRLWKYSKRGFAVAVPGFRRSMVDPRIYLKLFRDVHGLARLLHLEERDFQHSRLRFTDQRWGWMEVSGAGSNAAEQMQRNRRTSSILDYSIVSEVVDYNHGVLLPCGIDLEDVLNHLKERARRVLSSNTMDQPFNFQVYQLDSHEAENTSDAGPWKSERKNHLYYIFARSFDGILDTKMFSFLAKEIANFEDEENGAQVILDVPQFIGFIGSLQEYIASLPDVVDDWYAGALLAE